MADKVVINLATGLEDAERVTVAFLVANAAANAGKRVTMFLSKEAVRIALPGHMVGIACDGCPPLASLASDYAQAGGELLVCSICFQRPRAERGRSRRERTDRWRDAVVGVDRRRRDRLQLLTRRTRELRPACHARHARPPRHAHPPARHARPPWKSLSARRSSRLGAAPRGTRRRAPWRSRACARRSRASSSGSRRG
jgi:predicted peroxiredoxin